MRHTHSSTPFTQTIIAEAEMLWPKNEAQQSEDLRFRKPRTKVLRALRKMQQTGTKVIITSRNTGCDIKRLTAMLELYGITPAHIASTCVGELRIKQALFFRYKPLAVYEDSPEVVAWLKAQDATVFTPDYLKKAEA